MRFSWINKIVGLAIFLSYPAGARAVNAGAEHQQSSEAPTGPFEFADFYSFNRPKDNQGLLGSAVDGWAPDLEKVETRFTAAMLIKL